MANRGYITPGLGPGYPLFRSDNANVVPCILNLEWMENPGTHRRHSPPCGRVPGSLPWLPAVYGPAKHLLQGAVGKPLDPALKGGACDGVIR